MGWVIRGDAMKQSLMIAALLLVAGAGNALAASCERPDISADRIQSMAKAGKSADDTITACTGEIHRLTALGNNNDALVADYEARAFAYEVKGMAPEARADYDQGVALAPGFPTWFNRSQFLIDAGLFDAAVEDLTQAIDFYDRTAPRQRGYATDALALQAHFQRGEALRREEKFDLAVADYSKVIAADPRNADAVANRAIAYSRLGQLDLDIADLTRLMALRKNDAIAYYNRGLAYRRKGDDARALEDFSETVTRYPTMAAAHVARGEVLEHMGQRDKALAEFREAAKIQPDLASAAAGVARLGGN